MVHSQETEHFVTKTGRPFVKAGVCTVCNKYFFPYKETCDLCKKPITEKLFSEGKVHSYTIVHTPAMGYDAPYKIGYIDLNDHIRMLSQIEFENELQLDTKMELICKSNSNGKDFYTFKPSNG